jgi:hypothetical protein
MAEENRRVAQQALDERNAKRAADERRVAEARRDLPVAEAAHAPFNEKVVAAKRAVSESQSALWKAEFELRKSGRVHRRSARREVESATDVLAAANDRLTRAEELASPTRAPLDDLRKIIDDYRQFDSTRRILARLDNFDRTVERASDLCQTLDGWKDWANGRDLRSAELVEIASALADHHELPGTGQLGESLARWADSQGVEIQRRRPQLRRSKWLSISEPACAGRAFWSAVMSGVRGLPGPIESAAIERSCLSDRRVDMGCEYCLAGRLRVGQCWWR